MTQVGSMRVRYRYLVGDRDRHGNVRIYYRRAGRKIRIREEPGSAAFAARYAELAAMFENGAFVAPVAHHTRRGPQSGTLGWLVVAYEASAAFAELEPSTRRTRRRLMAAMLDEPVHPGAAETYAGFPLPRLTLRALEVLRDRRRDRKGTANDRVKALRALFRWAAAARHVRPDPALGLAKLRVVSAGRHAWTLEEVARFEARHPLGTMACLALRLMLYTGARRSDAVRLGRQHLREGTLAWTAYKNRHRYPTEITAVVLPPLAEALAATATGDMVFLTTAAGRPFSIAGFGNWFRARCTEAGLPHCSAHGLRKAGAALAAEEGASAHMLMSMFGWRSLAEAERYTKAAERRRMAAAGAKLLLAGTRRGRDPVPPPRPGRARWDK